MFTAYFVLRTWTYLTIFLFQGATDVQYCGVVVEL
jgi:hypothetical protein